MKAKEVTAGPAESNGSLLPGLWCDSVHVTCTPGSAPGPTLGNEYGKTLPFLFSCIATSLFNILTDLLIPSVVHVPELISVLCSQPAGDVSHKPGDRLPLLSARPTVTPATLNAW